MIHGMEDMYGEEKLKALEALLHQMHAKIAEGRGDVPIASKESDLSHKSLGEHDEEGEIEGSPEEELSESPEEEIKEDEKPEDAPISSLMREFMGDRKHSGIKPKSATIMVSKVSAKPFKGMKGRK